MEKIEVIDRANLTPREAQVLQLLCSGAVDKIIARQLAISLQTVEFHVANIYAKLGVRSASINSRCLTISRAIARGMVRVSSTGLCLALMFGALQLDGHALRVGRIGAGRANVMRNVRRLDG